MYHISVKQPNTISHTNLDEVLAFGCRHVFEQFKNQIETLTSEQLLRSDWQQICTEHPAVHYTDNDADELVSKMTDKDEYLQISNSPSDFSIVREKFLAGFSEAVFTTVFNDTEHYVKAINRQKTQRRTQLSQSKSSELWNMIFNDIFEEKRLNDDASRRGSEQ